MISESAAQRLANASPADPQIILLHYITECGLSGSNGQAHNFKIWTVASGHALDPKLCLLAHWACSICSVKWHMERNWRSHHWNTSLCAADMLMTIVSLWEIFPRLSPKITFPQENGNMHATPYAFKCVCVWGGGGGLGPLHMDSQTFMKVSKSHLHNTEETQYNKIILFVISVFCKQCNLFHWDQRKQFVVWGILLYQISLHQVSTVLV